MCVPLPAKAGLKVLPLVPLPVKKPPVGVAERVIGVALLQRVLGKPLNWGVMMGQAWAAQVREAAGLSWQS